MHRLKVGWGCFAVLRFCEPIGIMVLPDPERCARSPARSPGAAGSRGPFGRAGRWVAGGGGPKSRSRPQPIRLRLSGPASIVTHGGAAQPGDALTSILRRTVRQAKTRRLIRLLRLLGPPQPDKPTRLLAAGVRETGRQRTPSSETAGGPRNGHKNFTGIRETRAKKRARRPRTTNHRPYHSQNPRVTSTSSPTHHGQFTSATETPCTKQSRTISRKPIESFKVNLAQ
jgi:hypothetical protein